MKKFAFALIAVAATGLAACDGRTAANSAANSGGATTNEAITDVDTANEAHNALDVNANGMISETREAGNAAGRVVENATGAVSNSVTNGARSVGNSVERTTTTSTTTNKM